jgi:WD40 repeat protein
MTGKQVFSFTSPSFKGSRAGWNSVAWSPNGQHLAIGGAGDAIVLDAATGKRASYFGHQSGSVHAVSWSPDSTFIAVGEEDSTIGVWNITTHQNVYTYTGHTTDVFCVAWSPDGKSIASGSGDGLVEVWDAFSGKHVYTYRGHADMYFGHLISGSNAAVDGVSWSPDGKRIASASSDNTVQVWNA